jgi:elongation factor Tu
MTMSTDPTFRMTVEDVFSIRGRGTVATGKVESGSLSKGDEIFISRGGAYKKVVVSGLEMFRKTLDQVNAGDNVGVLLAEVTKDDLQRGDVLTGSGAEFSWNP